MEMVYGSDLSFKKEKSRGKTFKNKLAQYFLYNLWKTDVLNKKVFII